MLHVIEHLDNPNGSLQKIHNILKPNGKIVIGTPNAKTIDRILFRKYWDGWDTPRHIYVYNYKNLKALLEKNGFKNISVHYEIYSIFHRSLINIYKYKNKNPNKITKFLSSRINTLFSYILPLLNLSGAIQVIAEKPQNKKSNES